MKRFAMALVLALAIAMCSVPALSEEATPAVAPEEAAAREVEIWSNGQSAEQPYAGVPPVDLTEKLGYMMLNPINNSNVDAPLNTLRIYLPRTDVAGGEGALKLYESGIRAPLEEIPLADVSRVTLEPIDEDSLAWLYWESGVCFTVKLSRTLDIDKAYTISIDENAIVVPEYDIGNPMMEGRTGWSFTTQADTGVTRVHSSGGDTPKVGDVLTVDVKYGGAGISAAIYSDSDAIEFDADLPDEEGTLHARYAQAGEVEWSVVFVGESGEVLSQYRYQETVEP
jgi:hypothetical protein